MIFVSRKVKWSNLHYAFELRCYCVNVVSDQHFFFANRSTGCKFIMVDSFGDVLFGGSVGVSNLLMVCWLLEFISSWKNSALKVFWRFSLGETHLHVFILCYYFGKGWSERIALLDILGQLFRAMGPHQKGVYERVKIIPIQIFALSLEVSILAVARRYGIFFSFSASDVSLL